MHKEILVSARGNKPISYLPVDRLTPVWQRALQTVRRQGRGGASLSVFVEVVAPRAVAQKGVTGAFLLSETKLWVTPGEQLLLIEICKLLLDTGPDFCFM